MPKIKRLPTKFTSRIQPTVSYTHLDVYKRQVLDIWFGEEMVDRDEGC